MVEYHRNDYERARLAEIAEVPAELLDGEAGVDQTAKGHFHIGRGLELDVEQDLPALAAAVGDEEHIWEALVELFGEEFVGQLRDRGEIDPGGQV